MVIKMQKKYITEQEKIQIIKHLISKGYLTENQIKTLKKRNNL
jgi:hypothetical protein